MKILLDSFGLDKGTDIVIEAGKLAQKELDVKIDIIGLSDIEKKVTDNGLGFVLASETIEPGESNPAFAIRQKKDSTIVKGLFMLKEGVYDAFVSGGSTGAVLAGGMVTVGRIKGVERAALIAELPSKKGFTVMLDMGANVDSKPETLVSFALMASNYMKSLHGVENPSVMLLNNGAEAHKGNELTRKAYDLLKQADINFKGNIEARYIFDDLCDIIVTDGYYGNLVLKSVEGQFRFMKHLMKKATMNNMKSKIGMLMLKDSLKKEFSLLDASKYGGVPLLGLKKVVVKAHGNSNQEAFYNSIAVAKKTVLSNMNKNIEEAFSSEV